VYRSGNTTAIARISPLAPHLIRPWLVALVVCLAYLGLMLARHGDVMELIQPARAGREGYDGQFTYYIARNPLGAPAAIAAVCAVPLPVMPYTPEMHPMAARLLGCEMPAYRYQRALHGLLARLLALGQEALIPWAMLALSAAGLAVGVWSLERLLVEQGASRWYALTYGLFPGIFFAVRVSTTEPLAYGLVLLAILAAARQRLVVSAVLLALAAFTKETTLFFVAGYLAYFALSRRWRDAIRLGLLAGVPFAAWQLILWGWLGQSGIGSGGLRATPFEIIPYNGIWRIAGIESATWSSGALLALMFFPVASAMLPSLWALWHCGLDFLRRRWHPYVFLLGANAAIMPFVPFSTYVEPLGIVRFLPGLVIGVLLYAALRKRRRALVYSTIWIAFGLLFLT
jgi:hypothetical protein